MKRSLSIPGDALFKKFMSNVTLAKVFLEVYLPTSVKQNCDFNTLQIANGSFVDTHLRQDFSDIVYTLNVAGAPGYIYAVIEHESAVGRLPPFKLLRYQTAVMQQHLDQGNKLLPVVVPLLFYRGQTSSYPGPLDPDELLQSILKYLVKEGKCIDYSQFIQLVIEIASNYREEIMTLGQQLEQKDYQEDYQKGRRETILEIVSNMLATGMPLDRIKELTKLSNRDLAESISAL
ncbi:Putative uncharacterized protein [Mycoavidus cysteinexigens]|uniref:Transposase (putative) YhgA-like domain-containing protein n=1 Tax=Mycoavidus cysteinexigens TaxID=1553431 RepID=A0A2Z6EUD0_9BURK|nr:Rpn family recombination-promoting nuclease/putative transposase [Mycoavidus cysteinexigens]BBE09026.1 Putative uncharacterized protein [Mycoavidus cysteinexigens]GAM52247.1 putative transposase [bacterium endosymbiont of Mortierella elongata FMR23-6]GLR00307.1 hypothetical protein GCM10007934_01180 [Mycoavidus cysteinexigens]